MVKPRVVETTEGIQGEFDVEMYDRMMRRMRDRGWLETRLILKAGIQQGMALEVGPGPGYLGLEWLKQAAGATLQAVEISPNMIAIAERNAREYGLENRVTYVTGDAQEIPFDDSLFDGVFTNGSLHEWAEPKKVFNEINRVLKPGGKYCVTDLRRDMRPLVKWLMKAVTKPKEMRPGLISSIRAAYTAEEIQSVLRESDLDTCCVNKGAMGLTLTGQKAG
jgi:ubiquinone/menaquinone biosynthesis C-methylase UbiE